MADTTDSAYVLASRFVEARRDARALARYPGDVPSSLDAAYAVQDAAIELWGDAVVGWKVGLVGVQLRAQFGAERIAGPIFAGQLYDGGKQTANLPLIPGGFGAVEAEFIILVGDSPPPDRTSWTPHDTLAHIDAIRIGVEFAGSPFPGINDFGPAVTASDFGNNSGLILGGAIDRWRDRPFSTLRATTEIDGAPVGAGNADGIPGGPLAAFAFILEHCARRGRPLRTGDLVSTGAVTGVHVVSVGQTAHVDFGGDGRIACDIVAARPTNARAASA